MLDDRRIIDAVVTVVVTVPVAVMLVICTVGVTVAVHSLVLVRITVLFVGDVIGLTL